MSQEGARLSRNADQYALLEAISVKAVWLHSDSVLKLVLLNSNASLTSVKFKIRYMHLNGEIIDAEREFAVTKSDRSAETVASISEFRNVFLISCEVFPGQTTRYGQTLAQVIINNAKYAIDVCMLLHGYLESTHSLATGLYNISEKAVKSGYLRVVVGTQPAAGAEISETVPTNARWEVIAVTCKLTASATVANRLAYLYLTDGTNDIGYFPAGVTQTASQVWYHTFGAGIGSQLQYAADFTNLVMLPVNLEMLQGWKIQTFTSNMAAGDQWNAPTILVKERLEE